MNKDRNRKDQKR